ncbi:hypothetical protein CCACVL1_01576 [Corchorus capsularis]|uniref:Uncharacterized protein n=1 Tax=Corchorus capsularis TaxID=210143 RepID=A0A1R3KH89_COCAP|nr:hypothetical protein CCACVL1_01576 [Corchorus capsularis]
MFVVAPRAASASSASECSEFVKTMENTLCNRSNNDKDEVFSMLWSPCAVAKRFSQALESGNTTKLIPVCECTKEYLKKWTDTNEAADHFMEAFDIGRCEDAHTEEEEGDDDEDDDDDDDDGGGGNGARLSNIEFADFRLLMGSFVAVEETSQTEQRDMEEAAERKTEADLSESVVLAGGILAFYGGLT